MSSPKFSPDALADLKTSRAAEETVFFKEIPPRPGACPNCAGMGVLWLQFVKSGPYDTPPGGSGLITHYNNAWYRVESRFYPCPVCRDPQQRQAYLWDLSGLESHERTYRLDYLEGLPGKESILQSARELLSLVPRPSGWLTLYGDYGTGKTGVLKSLVAACIRAGVSAHYARAEDILRSIRATFGPNPLQEEDLFHRYARYQLLAIDEVDRTSDSGWSRSTLMTLLDTRYTRRQTLATVIATNRHPGQLPAELSYLASRMLDGERVHLSGPDLRALNVTLLTCERAAQQIFYRKINLRFFDALRHKSKTREYPALFPSFLRLFTRISGYHIRVN
jgi:DNA replication protein DnaC